MLETSVRLLRLLALLQAHRNWTGTELAEHLEVTTRTVRRDVERLRELGYPVEAAQGRAGYQLGPGGQLPPLLLEDEEAVAVVLGLREAAQSSVRGIEEASIQALAKLEQVLPSRLRYRANTLTGATVHAGNPVEPLVPVDTLLAVADACRRRQRLRFDYSSPRSGPSRRDTEPHQMVCFNRRWYLVAFDIDQEDWRTFRVDRLAARTPSGPRFIPREIPHGDAVTYLEHQLSSQTWPYRAVVRLNESTEDIAERIWPGMGALEPDGPSSCLLHLGAPTPRDLMWMITSVDADFELIEAPPELAAALLEQAARCSHAVTRQQAVTRTTDPV